MGLGGTYVLAAALFMSVCGIDTWIYRQPGDERNIRALVLRILSGCQVGFVRLKRNKAIHILT